MNKAKNKFYKVIIILILMLMLIPSGTILFLLRYSIKKTFNEIFNNSALETLDLTTEQKIHDFEDMYSTIVLGYPNINDIYESYSINFEERKPYYLDLVKETENDFEFYCTILAILQDLSSYHTNLCFPDYNNLRNTDGYNLDRVLAEKNLIPYTNYWNQLIEKYCNDYSDVGVAEFKYIDGKYVYDLQWSSEKYDELQSYYISSIDGIDVNEYVMNNISIYGTQFDIKNDRPYKRVITLNDSIGDRHDIVMTNDSGNSFSKEFFTSLEMEVVNTFYVDFIDNDEDSYSQDISDFYDDKNNILYVAINNFDNNNGKQLQDVFAQADGTTQIIIDMRENYGGYTNYAKNYIYPYLYNKDVVFEQNWFVPSSELNDREKNKFQNKLLYKTEKNENGTLYKSTTKYEGGKNDYSDNVYYLIGKSTASAADEYIAMIKENDLGTIIGTDTAGEGLGGSFLVCMMKNSGLVYTYYPCQAYNSDGSNNAVIGTMPDIYINQTVDSFRKQRQMQENNNEYYSFENRLDWDNILVETLNINK